jgi:uncharacterized protein (DUF1800 family)
MHPSATIAANRFGLGARPGELRAIGADGRGWLLAQIERPGAAALDAADLLSGPDAFRAFLAYRQTRKNDRDMEAKAQADQRMTRVARGDLVADTLGAEVEARVTRAVTTPSGFCERWTHFWSNWFTVAARNLQTIPLAGPFEREAIRPHVFASFRVMLHAATAHPGMLVQLDQAQSVGPNSRAGMRRRAGLNENLAREILELHTLGPDGGYSQADVTEFAKALTGWTVAGPRLRAEAGGMTAVRTGEFHFAAALHEPGARRVRGKTYPEGGQEQARAILDALASDPAVARRVARALAVHFVADVPPPALVARLEASFRRTDGDLRALARTLIESPEAWSPQAAKFKTPHDFLISALRAGGVRSVAMGPLRQTFEQLGQAPFRAPSPKGWPDGAEHWAAPDAILKRADWADLAGERFAETLQPFAFAEEALGASLQARTRQAIARAESPRQAFVLALMSPEFQRR